MERPDFVTDDRIHMQGGNDMDQCPDCKGKMVSAWAAVPIAEVDECPYEDGVYEEARDGQIIEINDGLNVLWCEECKAVKVYWFAENTKAQQPPAPADTEA